MPLLIIDRDGVINEESDEFIKTPEEWRPIPGSLEAIARACQAGFRIVVVSNQSGLARNVVDIDNMNLVHQEMHRRANAAGGKIDAIFLCPHGPLDNCRCRKPHPGLLLDIADRLRTKLDNVPFVGDRISDLIAAKEAGAIPVLVRTGRGAQTERDEGNNLENIPVYDDLKAVVDDLLLASK